MANLINSNFNEKNCNNLQEEWTINNVKQESLDSSKNTGYQQVNETTRVSETLINKKIIYSTEHITKINITETKTKQETFMDPILGTKESNKNTKETQSKSKNMITFQQTNNKHQNNESEKIGDALEQVLNLINRQPSSTETIIHTFFISTAFFNSLLVLFNFFMNWASNVAYV